MISKQVYGAAYFPPATGPNENINLQQKQIIVQYEDGYTPDEVKKNVEQRESISKQLIIGPLRIAGENTLLRIQGKPLPETVLESYQTVDKNSKVTSSRNLLRKVAERNTPLSNTELVTLENSASVNDAVSKFKALPTVENVSINSFLFANVAPNDPRFSQEWALQKINAESAWNTTRGDSSVIVAVIDSGVDSQHPDLAGHVTKGYDFINNDADPNDLCGHGTHVAGTIGAVTDNAVGIAGINWDINVLAIKSLGKTSSGCGGPTQAIVNGIVFAADNGAKVINMSLGGSGSCDAASQQAINYARSRGATVVVAAGNENDNASNHTPANCQGVIVVGATDNADNRSSYSNYGSIVTMSAPGGDRASGTSCSFTSCIISTYVQNGQQGYASAAGTSMAAPHVAGAAALLLSLNSNLSPDQVKNVLVSSADSISTDLPIGNRLNLANAIQQVSGNVATPTEEPPPTEAPTPTEEPPPTEAPTPTDTTSICNPDGSGTEGEIEFGDLRLIRQELAGIISSNNGSCLTDPANDPTSFSDLRRARRIIANLENL